MNPQDLQQFQDALQNLQSAVNQLAGTTGVLSSGLQNFGGSVSRISPTVQNVTNSLNQNAQNIAQSGNAISQAQGQAASQLNAFSNTLSGATQNLKTSTGNMVQGFMNASASLNNLGGVGGFVGNALKAIGIAAGGPTAKFTIVAQALEALASSVLGSSQAYLEAKNSLGKLGSTGALSSDQLYTFARSAGLAANTLDRMVNPMMRLGTSISGLGYGAADAQKAFMEMLQVGQSARIQFARIGIMQEEMMARQADFVSAMDTAGVSMRNQNTDMNKLRTASLEYIRNLYELSALTGQSVDEIRDRQKAALDDRRVVMETRMREEEARQLREEADELRRQGDERGAQAKEKEADEIERNLELNRKLYMSLQALPQDLQQGIKQYLMTGTLAGPEAQQLVSTGLLDKLDPIVDEMRKTGDANKAAQRITEEFVKGQRQIYSGLGPALQLQPTDEQARLLGVGKEAGQFGARFEGRDLVGELDAVRQNLSAAAGVGVDSLNNIQAGLQELSITANQAAESLNFLIGQTDKLSQGAADIAKERIARGEIPSDLQNIRDFKTGIDAVDRGVQSIYHLLKPILGGNDEKRPAGDLGGTEYGMGSSWKDKRRRGPPPPEQQTQPQTQQPAATQQPATAPAAPTVQQPTGPEVAAPAAPAVQPTAGPEQTPTQPVTERPQEQTVPETQKPADVTPVPNYQRITVKSNLGNNIILSPGGVAKVADFIRKGLDRNQLRREVRNIANLNSQYDDSTIDKLIDQSAAQANLTTPAGSLANVTAPPAIPIRPPETKPEAATPAGTPTTGGAAPTPQQPAKVEPNLPTVRISDRARDWAIKQLQNGRTPQQIKDELIRNGYDVPQADAVVKAAQQKTQGTTGPRPNATPAAPAGPQQGPQQTQTQGQQPPSVAPPTTARPTTQKMSLEQLAEEGLGRYFRGPQGKFDTQREGGEVDTRLLDAAKKLTQADLSPFTLQRITALNDNFHATRFKDNAHSQGRALDFTLDKPPTAENFRKLDETLRKIGFDKVENRYANYKTGIDTGPHIHAEVNKLRKLHTGGMIGSDKGEFPILVRGNEMFVPLHPNSILAELGKKSAEQVRTEMSNAEQNFKIENKEESGLNIDNVNKQLMEMLSSKLDTMINKLDTSNDTQDRILRHTQS